MIRVVVVDDQTLVRAGFSVLLKHAEDIEVVGEAGDGLEAVEIVTHERRLQDGPRPSTAQTRIGDLDVTDLADAVRQRRPHRALGG